MDDETAHGVARSFEDGISASPLLHDADRGTEAAALYPEASAQARQLIAGAAGSSPYLAALLRSERDWLAASLARPAATVLDDLLAQTAEAGPRALHDDLRQAKRRVALLTALADLGGVWTLEEVTTALTRFADAALGRALAASLSVEVARGRLPADPPGLTAFAMGKMGAFELNYSSDIDLIVLFDDELYRPADLPAIRSGFIRATRAVVALLSDTRGGYVFRTDLRLRPDAATTPVCLSMDAAERYYESVGRTWERAAWIKARPAAGDLAAGDRFLDRMAPFVWRRHLDFWAIRDAQDMRMRIRREKETGTDGRLDGRDLKLGPGGIREIEFYTQTRQIILGGRDPELRPRGTVAALRRLKAAGQVDEADALIDDYRAFRGVEHRLQMIADQQTHRLPRDAEGWERVAALCDTDADTLRARLRDRLRRVEAVAERYFTPAEAPGRARLDASAEALVRHWPSYPALRSSRAVEIFERLKPRLLSRLGRASNPTEALHHFDSFLKGLPAGVQVFALFEANPQLSDLIVDIAATSPALAQYLGQHPAVLDAVVGGDFFAPWPGQAALAGDLSGHLARAGGYEGRLLAARHWRNEWHFRIGVHLLRGHVDALEAGRCYADLAEAVLAALWPWVAEDFARRHGPMPGQSAAVIAMGSLGAGAMTPTSDLDLIVIYDAGEAQQSDGPRPLPVRTYYARLTQAFITAVSAKLGPGLLYDIDMRLRPSGRKGPVATALTGFRTYQTEEAWTWEHLALTRARPVAGCAELGRGVEAFRADLLRRPRAPAAILRDVAEMRDRLARDRPGAGDWDMASGPGRLQDIALLAQAGALLSASTARSVADQLAAGADAVGLSADEARDLAETAALLFRVLSAGRLLTGGGLDPDTVGEGGRAVLAREGGAADLAALRRAIDVAAARAQATIGRALREGLK